MPLTHWFKPSFPAWQKGSNTKMSKHGPFWMISIILLGPQLLLQKHMGLLWVSCHIWHPCRGLPYISGLCLGTWAASRNPRTKTQRMFQFSIKLSSVCLQSPALVKASVSAFEVIPWQTRCFFVMLPCLNPVAGFFITSPPQQLYFWSLNIIFPYILTIIFAWVFQGLEMLASLFCVLALGINVMGVIASEGFFKLKHSLTGQLLDCWLGGIIGILWKRK